MITVMDLTVSISLSAHQRGVEPTGAQLLWVTTSTASCSPAR